MTIGGPKGPSDAQKGLAKVLQLRTPSLTGPEKAAPTEKTAPTSEATTTTKPEAKETPTATFEGTTGTQQTIAAPVDGAGASQVMARLKARGLDPSRKVTKTSANSGPSIVQTAEGKVHNGSVSIESKSGLQKLVDVVRVGGDLTIHEGVVKNGDLLALKSLKSVERRLTFEGLRSS